MTVRIYQRSGALMQEIASQGATLVVTSPPYYPDSLEDALADSERARRLGDRLEQQVLSFAAHLRAVFAECARVLSQKGAMVLQTRDVRIGERLVAVESAHRLCAESEAFHLYTRHEWRPANVSLDRQREVRAAMRRGAPRPVDPEVFLVFFRDEPALGEPLEKDIALLASPTMRTPRGRLPAPHRHQSPLPVLEAFIRCYSKPGDLVVDPFAGGGTTLRVAESLGRRAMGYDIDPAALDLATRNLLQ